MIWMRQVILFQAIGNYGPDNNYESSGMAIFDEVATGKRSFLENSVAIYKVRVDPDGNGAFLMWHEWKTINLELRVNAGMAHKRQQNIHDI